MITPIISMVNYIKIMRRYRRCLFDVFDIAPLMTPISAVCPLNKTIKVLKVEPWMPSPCLPICHAFFKGNGMYDLSRVWRF